MLILFFRIDSQLIETIERIRAEAAAHKKDEEIVVHNPSIFKELTAMDTNRNKKSSEADADEEADDGQRKLSDSFKMSTSREALKSGKVRSSMAAAATVGATVKAGMPNKNDSGYSEPTTANSTPTGKQATLEAIKQQNAKLKNKMPDVDSVV